MTIDYIGRTSTTSGTKCFSKFWMPCCNVAVDDGHVEQLFGERRTAGGFAARKLHRAAVADDAAGNELERCGIGGGFGLNEHGFSPDVAGSRPARSLSSSRWRPQTHDQGERLA